MNEQLTIFDTGTELRDQGMKKAVDHADAIINDWSEGAYQFLLIFLQHRSIFMTEEVREASMGIVPEPPSLRAWGSVIVRAAKSGHIQRAGYKNVKNTKAHSTPATVWKKVKP